MKKLRFWWRRFLRRDWPIIRTGRPARALTVLIFSFLFLFAVGPRQVHAGGVGGIVAGVVGGVLVLGAISAVAGSQRDIAKIEADKRVRLEEIRARTVLEAPCRLGQKGSASYESTEGDARIRSEVEGAPCPKPPQVSVQQSVPGGGGYQRPSCQRGDWELHHTPFGPRWTCSSTGEML